MRILIAGATGAIARPLVRCLKEERHSVFALARSPQSSRVVAELGAEPVDADALDAASVKAAVTLVRPDAVIDAVINELTALPRHYTAVEMKAVAKHDRKVRIEGNANLLAALQETRVRCYLLQSSGFWYASGTSLADERAQFAFDASPGLAAGARTYAELEAAALRTPGVELVSLRYGFFYGPGTWYLSEGDMGEQVRRQQVPVIGSGQGVWSFVHIDDAAAVTAAALENASAHTTWWIVTPHPSAYGCQHSPARPGHPCRLRSRSKRPLRLLAPISFTIRPGSGAHRTKRRNRG